MKRTYKLGDAFPYESFVQSAIERHFQAAGFEIDASGHVDLLCVHSVTRECWHIEAKGKTSDPGLDFRTCLGQLVQTNQVARNPLRIALPDLREYRELTRKVSPLGSVSNATARGQRRCAIVTPIPKTHPRIGTLVQRTRL